MFTNIDLSVCRMFVVTWTLFLRSSSHASHRRKLPPPPHPQQNLFKGKLNGMDAGGKRIRGLQNSRRTSEETACMVTWEGDTKGN